MKVYQKYNMINFPHCGRTSGDKILHLKGIKTATAMHFIAPVTPHVISKHIWTIIGVDSMKAFFPSDLEPCIHKCLPMLPYLSHETELIQLIGCQEACLFNPH